MINAGINTAGGLGDANMPPPKSGPFFGFPIDTLAGTDQHDGN